VIDGADGIAEVSINGRSLGVCRNSFYIHTFEPDNLVNGVNTISICFTSALEEFGKYPMRADMMSSYKYNAEAARFRRPAHIWGWDIFPRMALGGVFNGVSIREVPENDIEEFNLVTVKLNGNSANMRLTFKVTTPLLKNDDLTIRISGVCGKKSFSASQKIRSCCGVLKFEVPDAELWWPRRYGASPLYDVTLQLISPEGVLAEKCFKYGIRTCALIAENVATGREEPDFQFVVNNKKIRVFGTNHIPLDALHSRAKERYKLFFDLANECQVDMVRVWGGGVYENDEFYDLCDRYGILVWQDFMMGCAVYPQDEEFQRELETEAAHAVKRLRLHPSIVLWAGDNECDCAPSWDELVISAQNNVLTRKILPEVCRLHDFSRPFLPSSPWCSPEAEKSAPQGVDPTLFSSEQHLWGPRDYFKSQFYRSTRASFLSEFGYHGCPSAASVREFIPEGYCWPLENDFCRHHASNPFLPDDDSLNFRISIMYDQVREFFGDSVPDNLDDFSTASQIIQAEGLKFIIEQFRMKKKCSGLLWWNLIDGWPQFSDAVVDYYGRKKLAFHTLKNLHRKLLITLSECEAWHRSVMAANDSGEVIRGKCRITAIHSQKLFWEGDFELQPDTVIRLAEIKCISSQKELYIIEYETDSGEKTRHHYLAGYPQFDYNLFKTVYLKEIFGDIIR
jgi:beta-mannosidase